MGGWTGSGRHRRCPSAGQVFDASWGEAGAAAATVYSVREGREGGGGQVGGGACTWGAGGSRRYSHLGSPASLA
jgi:hypothetical protein